MYGGRTISHAVGVTQLAEYDFTKVDVEGSTPFARFEEHYRDST